MIEKPKKKYDLEDRTFQFALQVALFINSLPKTIVNIEHGKQVTRSSGSMGSNYIEANEALSKKDFCMRVKICRKEAKETIYWLKLILNTNNLPSATNIHQLIQEATELKKIFSAIIEKSY